MQRAYCIYKKVMIIDLMYDMACHRLSTTFEGNWVLAPMFCVRVAVDRVDGMCIHWG